MKIRYGFVTNSSSSSFILSFTNNEDFDDFYDYCEFLSYKEVFDLINNIKNNENRNIEELRKEAKEFLYHCYTIDKKLEYFKENINENIPFLEQLEIRKKLENSEELQELLKNHLNTTNYEKKCKKIDESEIIVIGEIWDSEGGLLEYSIRNGLLESDFCQWTDIVWNVG